MIYLIILSLIISAFALCKSYAVERDNFKTLEQLHNHMAADLEAHRNTIKTLDLICEYLKIGGEG